MLSLAEKEEAGWPRGWPIAVLSGDDSFREGAFAARSHIRIIGRVRLVHGDRVVVVDDRSWNRRTGSFADALDEYGVILDGLDPYQPTVHPVEFDPNTGCLHLLWRLQFGQRWIFASRMAGRWFGMPDYPIRVLDVPNGDVSRVLIEVDDEE